MPSDKQLAANRRNALKSTGPKSVCGKARSSRNSLKDGISSTCARLSKELPSIRAGSTHISDCQIAELMRALLVADGKLAQARSRLWSAPSSGSIPNQSTAKRLLRLERYSRAISALKILAARNYHGASDLLIASGEQQLLAGHYE